MTPLQLETMPTLRAARHPKPKPIPAVYFLFKGETVIYVGQTSDLTQRIYSHCHKGKRAVDFDSYAYLDASQLTGVQRRQLEAAYIGWLRPASNNMTRGMLFPPNHKAARELQALLGFKPMNPVV